MKDRELELLLRTAARRRKGTDSPADRLYASLRGDLEAWYRRREEASRTRKLCLPALCAVLLAAAVTYYATPALDYCLGDGMTYEAVAEKANNMLRL